MTQKFTAILKLNYPHIQHLSNSDTYVTSDSCPFPNKWWYISLNEYCGFINILGNQFSWNKWRKNTISRAREFEANNAIRSKFYKKLTLLHFNYQVNKFNKEIYENSYSTNIDKITFTYSYTLIKYI